MKTVPTSPELGMNCTTALASVHSSTWNRCLGTKVCPTSAPLTLAVPDHSVNEAQSMAWPGPGESVKVTGAGPVTRGPVMAHSILFSGGTPGAPGASHLAHLVAVVEKSFWGRTPTSTVSRKTTPSAVKTRSCGPGWTERLSSTLKYAEPCTPMSVSYTHLDVYKRQHVKWRA